MSTLPTRAIIEDNVPADYTVLQYIADLRAIRSTLVQTLFYGIFSAWVLWRRAREGRTPGAHFDWRLSAYYLRVPVLRKLFGEMADPGALNSIQLQEVLNLAGEALNRVQPALQAIPSSRSVKCPFSIHPQL